MAVIGNATEPAQDAAPQPAVAEVAPIATPSTGDVQAPAYNIPAVKEPRTGLAGIVDQMRDALTGGSGGWGKVAAEVGTGAAAGLAAGRGRGNLGKAGFAGVQQGEHIDQMQKENQQRQQQEQQRQTENQRQATLDQFNFAKLQHDIASQEFELAHQRVAATQGDIKFAEGQEDRQKEMNSADLGTYNYQTLDQVKAAHPEFWKDLHGGLIVGTPAYSPDGGREGIRVWLQKPDVGSQLAPKDSVIYPYAPPAKPGERPARGAAQTVSAPMTNNELTARQAAFDARYNGDLLAWQKAQGDADESALKKQQVKTGKAEESKDYAEGAAATARANADKAESGVGPEGAALVDDIGTGKITVQRLDYLLARNPKLLDAVTKKYPDFDSAKAKSYPDAYKDFTSGPVSVQINSGATALKHLNDLRALNTRESHILGTPDYNRYHNLLDTVAPELAKFYGDTTIPAIDSIKSTLGATLPGNRQAAIERQAKSMGEKFDSYQQQWKNAAPSKAYEAPMPGVDAHAIAARAALDPEFAKNVSAVYAADGTTLTGYLANGVYTPLGR